MTSRTMTDRESEFLAALADVLEIPSIASADDFHAAPLWGSLTAFALKVMLSQRFGKTLSLRDIDACATAGDLMAKVFA